jgi:hypothetical protein
MTGFLIGDKIFGQYIKLPRRGRPNKASVIFHPSNTCRTLAWQMFLLPFSLELFLAGNQQVMNKLF